MHQRIYLRIPALAMSRKERGRGEQMSMSNPTRRTRTECDCELNYDCVMSCMHCVLNANRKPPIVSGNEFQEARMETGKHTGKRI